MKKMPVVTSPCPSPRALTVRRRGRRMVGQSKSGSPQKPAIHFLLSNTIEFLLGAGESPEQLARELEAQAKCVRGRSLLMHASDAKRFRDSREYRCELTGVVHDWHREAAYTNQDGEPRQITEKALRALIGRRVPKRKVSASVRWMFENSVVCKTNRGMIALVGGRTVVTSTDFLDRATAYVAQYLQTELRNTDTPEPGSRDVNRAARVFNLPEKYVPLWRTVARERAQTFLEGVDNWLEDHARRNDAGPVREVAMHCFAYTEDSRGSKAGGTGGRLVKAHGL